MGLNQDLDNIKAIEDKLTANKVAKFAYTDHAYNNPLTEADGVTYYNVDNEQNIPVADPSVMNVNETVLTKGWRSQASSITRMLMNHFLGRVSYNLNKLNDNMSALLTTLRANLSNVVNTGDSANVSSGGTAKFTTGGAYNLLSSIAPYFSASTAYAVGDLVTYQNRLYECTTAHSAGAWNASHFTARSVQYVLDVLLAKKADLLDLASAFSNSTSYAVGDYVTYNGSMYRCTVAHSGAWSSSDFTLVTVGSDLALKADKTSLALPTDAVLHYSFDEVPDYPDGTATYIKDNNFTSADLPSWSGSNATISVENNWLKAVSDGTRNIILVRNYAYFSSSILSGKIVKIKLKTTFSVNSIRFQVQAGTYPSYLLNKISQSGDESIWISLMPSDMLAGNSYLVIQAPTESVDNIAWIEQIYIGDGSYSTPIIDNANGQFNSVLAQSFVADKGVSGKAVRFMGLKAKTIEVDYPSEKWDAPYTVTCWAKKKGSSIYFVGWDSIYWVQNHYIRYDDTQHNIWFDVNENTRFIGYICNITLEDDKWYHFAFVNNFESGKGEIWINGIKQALSARDITVGRQEDKFLIGGTIGENGYNTDNSNSVIDDFQIFDRALTEDEVMALYLNKANTPKYYGEVPVTRKINGYTLEKDITLTKADVGLNNVANTGDSATPASGGTTKFTTGGAYTELAKKVDKTTTVNGHALSSNVTVSKSDVGLGSVVNTGDSATPVSGGTTKFTTGGAYTELAKKVDKTTKVNGHALSGNVTVTKGDVSLGNVANTGDSAVPAENGTDKFTTGGAFDFFGKQTDANAWLGKVFGWALGKNWTQGTGETSDSFYVVYYANGIWVAGSVGHGLWWSTDGKAWTHGTGSMTSDIILSIYYANGIWVAGSRFHGLWWSTDGKTWIQGQGSMLNHTFRSVYYANGIWVAGSDEVGLWWSTDGKTWIQGQGSMLNHTFRSVYYANGIWVAGSDEVGLWWSTDGKAWTQGTGETSDSFYVVYYANGIWVAGSVGHGLWWSTDGKAWTHGTGSMTSDIILSIYYANGIWVAGSDEGGLWWSTDGKAWTHGTGSMTSDIILSIYYANGIWVAGSRFHGLWWSTDGKAWTQGTGETSDSFYVVYYANGIWVAGSVGHGLWWSDFTNADIQ